MVERAMIVLAAGEGEPAAKIAERVGCSEQTVLRWRTRYEQDGLAGCRISSVPDAHWCTAATCVPSWWHSPDSTARYTPAVDTS